MTTPGTEGPLFRAAGLTREFRRDGRVVRAVDGIDLEVHRGDQLGIVGESGSGKTTLIRLLAALDRPTSGQVWFNGQDVTRASSKQLATLRSQVQIVFQDPRSSLDPRMRVGEIVAEPLTSRLIRRLPDTPRDVRARVAEVLELVGLEPQMAPRHPHEFSGGQRQRIAIARALAPRPRVLIADEPVSALDVSVRAQVLNLLTDLVRQEDLTMLFVSHDLAVVRHVCDRVAVMRQGRIVEHGPLQQVWDAPSDPYTKELLAAMPRLAVT
ncbi:ATP-binding cassette domain-containing protein [Aestuariimicrobium ganziense]|uniref:ATP-binding cassette domain-containing protein n=1 Tax=Aestuariimicrobium ganziense TaxID=2773677 RepID=UPI0019423910|nr:ATP-binding cassette domain-containing protein [Aestuariimicrobium ganziense]